MAKPRKRYHEDDKMNDLIWKQMHEYGWVSRTYLMRHTGLSDECCRKAIEGLPRPTETKIRNWITRKNREYMESIRKK